MSTDLIATDLNIVAVSGSLHYPSKTTSLVTELAEQLGSRLGAVPHVVRIDQVGPLLAGALRRSELPPEVERELRAIETADVLVVASPVYRASFTGLFKHLFDFVDQYALVDTPVLLAATGGSERHALILEHQFRPLFGFFQALTLPIGVYAHDSDFEGAVISSPRLAERIAKAVAKSMPIIISSLNERTEIQRAINGELDRAVEVDVRRPVRLDT
jgi:FMN reductase